MKNTLPLAILLLGLVACGNDHWVGDSTDTGGMPTTSSWNGRDLGLRADNKGLPPVYVSRTVGPRGSYAYTIRGEQYIEREFLGLCRSLLRDDPNLTVNIVPEDRMSKDEIGLVSARIRDVGIKTVAVFNSSGNAR